LRDAIALLKKAKIPVILIGMKMPPNYGAQYTQNFEKAYQEIIQAEKIPFYPFLLEGVAGVSKLNQPDGIHPNEEGHKIMSENLFKFLKAYL
jgi:acyl-CoA thioesterase-1